MQSESFLDSAAFKIQKGQDNTGFINKDNKGTGSKLEDASLAEGVGREKISGIMPLYLFKEHWEIARRKAPPIYGFLCTLDIMGFT
jgi:hypothetical protein